MPGPKILPGILIVLPATILLTAQSGFGASTSGECRASPGASAPAGLHWYYRVERTNNRHCWFLHSDGMQIRAHEDVIPPKPRHESVSKQARETTPTQSSTIQIAPSQPETAPTAREETPFLAPSLPEHTARDFAARWRDLPKSVDLDARELATSSNGYAAEHVVTEAEDQMPSTLYNVRGADGGVRQNSAGEHDLRSILLAGVLGVTLIVLLRDALKIARILHRRAQRRRTRAGFETASAVWRHAARWRPPTSNDSAYSPETNLDELMRNLRRVDTELDALKSFARDDVEIITSPTDQESKGNYLDRRVHSDWSNPAAQLIREKT
jgi:hypothetical protein